MTDLHSGAAPAPSDDDRRGTVLAGVVIAAALMDMIDGSIVNVALPTVQRDLGASQTQLRWIVSGYMLAFAASLITAGRLGDRYGRRRLFLIGVVGFGATSLCAGLAQTPGQLVLARIAQGTTAALLMPQVLATLRTQFSGERRAKVFGAFGAVSGLAVAGGVILGGVLTQYDLFGLSWRAIFLVNVPAAIAITVVGLAVMPESRFERTERLDAVGAVVLAGALVAIVYPLIDGQRLGWPAWCFAVVACGVAALVVLALLEPRRERAGIAPVLQARLLRIPAFSAGLLVQLMFGVGLQGLSLIAILWLQLGHDFGPLHAGATFLAFTIGAMATAPFAGTLALERGRSVLVAGALVLAVGTASVAVLTRSPADHVGTLALAPGFLISGAGLGLLVVPLVNVTLAAVPAAVAGGASGLFSTCQQLGGALGVAVIGSVFFAHLAASEASGARAYDGAMRAASYWVIGAYLVCAALCLLLPRTAVTEEEAMELG